MSDKSYLWGKNGVVAGERTVQFHTAFATVHHSIRTALLSLKQVVRDLCVGPHFTSPTVLQSLRARKKT